MLVPVCIKLLWLRMQCLPMNSSGVKQLQRDCVTGSARAVCVHANLSSGCSGVNVDVNSKK
jgi:hypothetical protein